MRPAQKAPENPNDIALSLGRGAGFNEAGAKSAGKQRGRDFPHVASFGFNEAGAKSAGKRLFVWAKLRSEWKLQ